MKSMKTKDHNIVTRFFIPYLSLIAVLIIGMVPLYNQGVQIMKDKEIAKITATLETGVSQFEKTVVDINWATKNLSDHYSYMRLSAKSEPLEAREIYFASQVQKDFAATISTISMVDYAFLRFSNNSIHIDGDRVYRNIDSFYGPYLLYEDMDADTFFARSTQALPVQPIFLKSETSGGNEYLTLKFMDSSSLRSEGNTVYILTRQETIVNLLLGPELAEIGALRMINSTGEVMLLHNPLNLPISEDNKQILISREIGLLGFSAEVVAPADVYLSSAHEAMSLVLILALISVVVSLALAIAYAYRNSLPIRKILTGVREITGEKTGRENPYEYINRSLAFISTDRKKLVLELDNYKSRLRHNWIDNLINGYIVYDKKDSEAMGITFHACNRLLLFGQPDKRGDFLSGEWEYNLDTFSILSIIREQITCNTLIHEKDNKYIVALIPFGEPPYSDEDSIRELVLAAIDAIRRGAGLEVVAVVSRPIGDINLIFREYHRTKHMLESFPAEKSLVFLDDSDIEPESELPLTVLTKITELLLMGAYERLEKVYKTIFTPEVLRSGHFHQVYYSIRGRMIMVNHKLDENQQERVIIPDYDPHRTNAELMEEQLACAKEICGLVNSNKISHNNKLIADILAFIDKKYRDPQLSTHMIADHFNLSVKYVSQFIKSSTGKTYTEYLEGVRLSRAVELLRDGSKSVAQIAEEVGFVSQNTFYKSFRRVYQVSPSRWRNASKENH